MKKLSGLLASAFVIAVWFHLGGCYYDNFDELHPEVLIASGQCDTTGMISYNANIVPILKGNCGSNNSCHNSTGAGGSVILENYSGVKKVVETGQFWSAIIWDGNAAQMPKNSTQKINDCAILQIQKWIDAGAPNN